MLENYPNLKKNIVETYLDEMPIGASVSLPQLATMAKCTKPYIQRICEAYIVRGEIEAQQGLRYWRGQNLVTTLYIKKS